MRFSCGVAAVPPNNGRTLDIHPSPLMATALLVIPAAVLLRTPVLIPRTTMAGIAPPAIRVFTAPTLMAVPELSLLTRMALAAPPMFMVASVALPSPPMVVMAGNTFTPLVLLLTPVTLVALVLPPVITVTALVSIIDVFMFLARVALPIPITVLLAPDIVPMLVMILVHAIMIAALLEHRVGVDRRRDNGEDREDLCEKHSECLLCKNSESVFNR